MNAEQFWEQEYGPVVEGFDPDFRTVFRIMENFRDRELAIVRAECDRLKQRYAKLVKALSVAECLPSCDAYGHEEKCPNASVAERLVAAEAECERLKVHVHQLEGALDTFNPQDVAEAMQKQELDALKAERA